MLGMRLLAIIDPPDRLRPASDTTVAILDAALRRGHAAAVCELHELWLHGDEPGADVRWVQAVNRQQRPALHLREGREPHALAHFGIVLMRKDPPYDAAYHHSTQILERARGRTLLVNDPRGLREANEKLYIFNFPELLAPTIVTSDIARLRRFLDEQGGEMVIKPLDGFGGAGVFYVHADDRNVNVILETSTQQGSRWVMAQRYLPQGQKGDKRILLLAGQPIGSLLRVPSGRDIRGNLHIGGTGHRTELSDRERAICARLAPRLQQDGLHLVGIDVIDGYLTEINVTSPTGVQAIDALYGIRLEEQIMDWLETHSIE